MKGQCHVWFYLTLQCECLAHRLKPRSSQRPRCTRLSRCLPSPAPPSALTRARCAPTTGLPSLSCPHQAIPTLTFALAVPSAWSAVPCSHFRSQLKYHRALPVPTWPGSLQLSPLYSCTSAFCCLISFPTRLPFQDMLACEFAFLLIIYLQWDISSPNAPTLLISLW